MRRLIPACLLFLLGAVAGADEATAVRANDERLKAAEEFVRTSDRYLHHWRLKEGMTGYGLTVMSGVKIDRFDATVVSVMRNYAPHQDMILCRLGGLGLEKGGIIAGMSGSPVYVKDPADGKDKLIGAVAFGWNFQKEPLCGLQPITQMLAISGVPLPGRAPASQPSGSVARAPVAAALDEELAAKLLQPGPLDLAALSAPPRNARIGPPGGPEAMLAPLAMPVTVSGSGQRAMELMQKAFGQAALLPVQAGAAGPPRTLPADVKLQPGSAIAIPLVSGDSDWTAVGTVTEVIGDYVLALGHPFQSEGPTEFPMGTGYVHTVVASLGRSFKLAASLDLAGTLTCDEATGVGGRIGQKAEFVPLSVTVRSGQVRQDYHYMLARHRRATALLAATVVEDSVLANRNLPEGHTLEYAIDIEFPGLTTYHAANRSSGEELVGLRSDLLRPVAAMMNAPVGEPVTPKSIAVTVSIEPVRTTAAILGLKLEQNRYRPGETVRGQVILQPYRAERTTLAVSLPLPPDLRDGRYVLTACDAADALAATHAEMPHRFAPKTPGQLLEAIQRMADGRNHHLYLRLPLPTGGLAIQKDELERMPASMVELLCRTAPVDASAFRSSQVVEFASQYVLSGSAQAEIVVDANAVK